MATSLNTMMNKAAASSIIPLANRTTAHSNYTSAIFTTPLKISFNLSRQVFQRNSIPTHHHFTSLDEKRSSIDDTLLSLIESEIEKSRKVAEAPRDFPFKIVDNPKEKFITLTREYQDEDIQIEAYLPCLFRYKIEMEVRDLKKGGPTLVVYVDAETADDITITLLGVKNPNDYFYVRHEEPNFTELDEDLQKAFYKYLEVRGIDFSFVKLVYNFLVQKGRKDYPAWFKNMKSFITLCNTRNNSTQRVSRSASVPTHHDFTSPAEKRSNSDDALLSLIGSESDCADQKFHEFAETVRDLPFKIEDNGREPTITLTKKYKAEKIEVRVSKSTDPQKLYLFVRVLNRSGFILTFAVAAGAADGIKIDSLNVRDDSEMDSYSYNKPKPRFSEMDEKLQKAFYTYLEVRGIKPSFAKILCDYMVQRKHKTYSTWLKDLKNYIAN